MVPPLDEGDAEGRQIFDQHIPHPVQFPAGTRLVPGQTGAELLLHEVIGLIEAGADLGVGRESGPGTGVPEGREEILPQAGQQDVLTPQFGEGDALLLPERMAPGHQQAGRVRPEGGAGQHFGRTAQVHHEAGVQLALLDPIGHSVVVQQPEPHLDVGILLSEFVELGLKAGQIVGHQRDADADLDGLGGLDLGMERGLHLLELLDHRRGVPLQAQAPVGQGELVVCADEQRAAQLGLQCGDALPQGLPRQKQPLGRAGVVHLLAENQKIMQLADVHGSLLKNAETVQYIKNTAFSAESKADGTKKQGPVPCCRAGFGV